MTFTLDGPERRRINYPKNRKRRPPWERFAEKVRGALGCWAWLGARNAAGYGYFWLDGRLISAHGYAYAEAYGPLPEGHEPDHLCENKGCVNPEHLEAVTGAENKRRGNLRRDRGRRVYLREGV